MKKYTTFLLTLTMIIATTLTLVPYKAVYADSSNIGVRYRTHIQTYGDQAWMYGWWY